MPLGLGLGLGLGFGEGRDDESLCFRSRRDLQKQKREEKERTVTKARRARREEEDIEVILQIVAVPRWSRDYEEGLVHRGFFVAAEREDNARSFRRPLRQRKRVEFLWCCVAGCYRVG